jgi:hypothetical protein
MINKAEIDGNGNIVIQDSDNTEVIINVNDPKEIRQFFIDFQNKLDSLPIKILELMESKNPNEAEVKEGANVYLGINLKFLEGGVIVGISFGVTITNLTKENRFINSPFFKFSIPFKGNVDTFMLLDKTYKIQFPKKLEYGEVVTEDYPLRPNSREIFDEIIAKDPNATIKAVVNTTVGEVYTSNEYRVDKLLENYKFAR